MNTESGYVQAISVQRVIFCDGEWAVLCIQCQTAATSHKRGVAAR